MKRKGSLSDIFWVATGGAIGAILRFGSGELIQSFTGPEPSAIFTPTAFENIIGSFAIGLVYTLLIQRAGDNHSLSLLLLTGVIGSYTTYSGFMVENLLLLHSDFFLFTGYFTFQIGTGILAAVTGIKAANIWVRKTRNISH